MAVGVHTRKCQCVDRRTGQIYEDGPRAPHPLVGFPVNEVDVQKVVLAVRQLKAARGHFNDGGVEWRGSLIL